MPAVEAENVGFGGAGIVRSGLFVGIGTAVEFGGGGRWKVFDVWRGGGIDPESGPGCWNERDSAVEVALAGMRLCVPKG